MAQDEPSSGAQPQPECHRFFFALRPDAATAQQVAAFMAAELAGKGQVRIERLHITLALSEDFAEPPRDVVAALMRAGETVRAASFDLCLDRLVGHRHVTWLAPSVVPAALAGLQEQIAAAMVREGVAMREGWTFTPHMTLAYRRAAPFERTVAPLAWPVRDLALVHSRVGLGQHERIGTWPLPDEGA